MINEILPPELPSSGSGPGHAEGIIGPRGDGLKLLPMSHRGGRSSTLVRSELQHRGCGKTATIRDEPRR